MSLEDLGNLGDFLGGLAVIVTLIYLAAQIRQNTAMLRSVGEQTARADSTATIALIAQSPENIAVYYKGLASPDTLSQEERMHFHLFMAAAFYHFQQGYTAYRSGMQSEDTWSSQLRALQIYASNAGVRAWWEAQGKSLFADSEFLHLADSEMRNEGPAA